MAAVKATHGISKVVGCKLINGKFLMIILLEVIL